ncbi:hypothetical protein HK097_001248 [Rhizophlyctis rosea]|uniref:Uncharacterized protein n=1 Tax=Rhizophlyctis rosea TaxID=64517 RepID=A0AAD5X872_9FUNG|nr:hypothetical protein HK097_001248 [Rhizophlyctis rosea]
MSSEARQRQQQQQQQRRNENEPPPNAAERQAAQRRRQDKKAAGSSILTPRNALLAATATGAIIYLSSPAELPFLRQARSPTPEIVEQAGSRVGLPLSCVVGRYVVTPETVPHSQAANACSNVGAELIDLNNEIYRTASVTVFNCSGANTAAWIKSYYGNNYDGAPVALTAGSTRGGGSVNEYRDGESRYALCKTNPPPAPVEEIDPILPSAPGAPYYLTVGPVTRAGASAVCGEKGGQLADLTTGNWNEATKAAFNLNGANKPVWISSYNTDTYRGNVALTTGSAAPGGAVTEYDATSAIAALCQSTEPFIPDGYEKVYGPTVKITGGQGNPTSLLKTTTMSQYKVHECAQQCSNNSPLCDFVNIYTITSNGQETHQCALFSRIANGSPTQSASPGTTISDSRAYRKINLVTDGSFESAQCSSFDCYSSSLATWTAGGQNAFDAAFINHATLPLRGTGVAVLGSIFDLDDYPGTISPKNKLNTIAGKTYKLSFWQQSTFWGPFLQRRAFFKVYWNGELIKTENVGYQSWKQFSYSVVAKGQDTFTIEGGRAGALSFIDDVELTWG